MATPGLPPDGELRLGSVLAASLRRERRRPWDSGEFCDPEDVTRIDQLDPASILRQRWDGRTHEDGVAEADEAGDVLPAMGWIPANWTDGALPVAAILRSWEDRFGARLLEVGFDEFRLLVDRPPRTLQAAQRIAAEQFAFADECACAGQVGLTEVGTIPPCLVGTSIWGFWWD